MDRSVAAFHEAGHAVMAWLQRIRVGSVSILEILDGGREGGYMSFDKQNLEGTQGRATAAICLMALAGQIAQGMHDPASLLEHPRVDDRDVVESELTSLGLSHEETVSMAKKLEDRAKKILDVYWDKVERVAAALIEQGVLTGEQFSQLMEEEPTMLA